MLQIILEVVGVVLVWQFIGSTLAAKGRSKGASGYQLLAVVAFVVGTVVGSVVAQALVDSRSGGLVLVLIVHFVVPLAGGAAGTGVVAWRVSRLPPTAAAARRAREAAAFNPFANSDPHVSDETCGHCGQPMLSTAATCPHCKQPRLPGA